MEPEGLIVDYINQILENTSHQFNFQLYALQSIRFDKSLVLDFKLHNRNTSSVQENEMKKTSYYSAWLVEEIKLMFPIDVITTIHGREKVNFILFLNIKGVELINVLWEK